MHGKCIHLTGITDMTGITGAIFSLSSVSFTVGISGVNLQGRDRYPYVKDHPPSRQPPPSLKTNNIPVKRLSLHYTKTGSHLISQLCLSAKDMDVSFL